VDTPDFTGDPLWVEVAIASDLGCYPPTVVTFDWDEPKAKQNFEKHRVSFAEAETVFDDPLARIDDDPDHSSEERREIIFARSAAGRLLLVSFVQRGETIRIISARTADKQERRRYEEEIL
jgi:uncharacterized protein